MNATASRGAVLLMLAMAGGCGGGGGSSSAQQNTTINAGSVHHAGIAYSRQGRRSVGQIILTLTQIWERMEPEEMRDWLVYL